MRVLSFLMLLCSVVTNAQIKMTAVDLCEYWYIPGDTDAYLINGKYAEGNLVVPEIVDFDGDSIPVIAVQNEAFKGNQKLTSIRLPSTVKVIEHDAFMNCNLSFLNIPESVEWMEYDLLYNSQVDTLIVNIKPITNPSIRLDLSPGALDDSKIQNLFLHCGSQIVFSNCYAEIKCMYLDEHLERIKIIDSFHSHDGPNPKSIVCEAVTPPAIDTTEILQWHEPIDFNWTVLFVPDESVEAYRNADFWQDFYLICPISERGRSEELISDANKARLAGLKFAGTDISDSYSLQGNSLTVMGDRPIIITVTDMAGKTLSYGVYSPNETLTLPHGINMVTLNGQSFKIAID